MEKIYQVKYKLEKRERGHVSVGDCMLYYIFCRRSTGLYKNYGHCQ